MCVLLCNGQPRRVAFTGIDAFWEDPAMCVQDLPIEPHYSMDAQDMLTEVRETLVEEMVTESIGGLINMRLSDDWSDNRYPGHRTNGKGGWIARNRGKKPEYKDRRLRASGSGKARAIFVPAEAS